MLISLFSFPVLVLSHHIAFNLQNTTLIFVFFLINLNCHCVQYLLVPILSEFIVTSEQTLLILQVLLSLELTRYCHTLQVICVIAYEQRFFCIISTCPKYFASFELKYRVWIFLHLTVISIRVFFFKKKINLYWPAICITCFILDIFKCRQSTIRGKKCCFRFDSA